MSEPQVSSNLDRILQSNLSYLQSAFTEICGRATFERKRKEQFQQSLSSFKAELENSPFKLLTPSSGSANLIQSQYRRSLLNGNLKCPEDSDGFMRHSSIADATATPPVGLRTETVQGQPRGLFLESSASTLYFGSSNFPGAYKAFGYMGIVSAEKLGVGIDAYAGTLHRTRTFFRSPNGIEGHYTSVAHLGYSDRFTVERLDGGWRVYYNDRFLTEVSLLDTVNSIDEYMRDWHQYRNFLLIDAKGLQMALEEASKSWDDMRADERGRIVAQILQFNQSLENRRSFAVKPSHDHVKTHPLEKEWAFRQTATHAGHLGTSATAMLTYLPDMIADGSVTAADFTDAANGLKMLFEPSAYLSAYAAANLDDILELRGVKELPEVNADDGRALRELLEELTRHFGEAGMKSKAIVYVKFDSATRLLTFEKDPSSPGAFDVFEHHFDGRVGPAAERIYGLVKQLGAGSSIGTEGIPAHKIIIRVPKAVEDSGSGTGDKGSGMTNASGTGTIRQSHGAAGDKGSVSRVPGSESRTSVSARMFTAEELGALQTADQGTPSLAVRSARRKAGQGTGDRGQGNSAANNVVRSGVMLRGMPVIFAP